MRVSAHYDTTSARREESWHRFGSRLALCSCLIKPSLFFNSLSSLLSFVLIAVLIWLQSTPNLVDTWSATKEGKEQKFDFPLCVFSEWWTALCSSSYQWCPSGCQVVAEACGTRLLPLYDLATSVWPKFLYQKVSSAALKCTSCSPRSPRSARRGSSVFEDFQQETECCYYPEGKKNNRL